MYTILKYDRVTYVWDETEETMYQKHLDAVTAEIIPASLHGLEKFRPELEFVDRVEEAPEIIQETGHDRRLEMEGLG